jgi:hypothetical protein
VKRLCIFIIAVQLFCFNAYTKVIDKHTKQIVYKIGLSKGVPKSVTDRLMYEESKYDDHAESQYTEEGYNSKGLFQLYTRPDNINDLIYRYWTGKDEFDIYNPVHNATVALSYLSILHKYYGNWYDALLFYNHGDICTASEGTKAYALRIIEAGNP